MANAIHVATGCGHTGQHVICFDCFQEAEQFRKRWLQSEQALNDWEAQAKESSAYGQRRERRIAELEAERGAFQQRIGALEFALKRRDERIAELEEEVRDLHYHEQEE